MMSLRLIARSAPRALSRTTLSVTRPTSQAASIMRQAWKPARIQSAAAFSTSPFRMEKGATDAELSAKLEQELAMEKEIRDMSEAPTSIKDYFENGPWEIVDTPGQEEVVLKRKFNDESIQVTFSIADINNFDPESDEYNPDPAYADEGAAEQPEKAEEEMEEDDEAGQAFPTRLSIVIEKASNGAIVVEGTAHDGTIIIDNVYHYSDVSLAHAKTPEAIHKRQDTYAGPPFANLDEELQVELERYLDERGIDSSLAEIIPEYIDMKEQKEYLNWLSNVKKFVDA